MKYNKWTLALAAAGVVTAPSLVLAAAPSQVLTAVGDTTLSGYVDTSAQWNLGTGNANNPPYTFGGAGKADGFNLNVVDIALDKPMGADEWASGYHVELWAGPDAGTLGTIGIRQAYVALRTPVGNGIDWKIGVWDTIIGYEGLTSYNNPNYTHSYGFTIEPTTHTGIQGTYKFSEEVSLTAGVANSYGPAVGGGAGGRAVSPFGGNPVESFKTYMATITLTAPTSWGWVAGSTFTAGVINGYNPAIASENGNTGARTTSLYAGATLSTPVAGLKAGVSFDYLDIHSSNDIIGAGEESGKSLDLALYASYQATPKLALNLRGEYFEDGSETFIDGADNQNDDHYRNKIFAVTATAQYDLWQNVVSRLELRWDHADNGPYFGGVSTSPTPNRKNAYLLAANIIYKF